MNVAVFGGFGKRVLSAGWVKETSIAFAGGGEFDLTGVAPGENARLTAIALFGGIDVIVDEGTNVTLSGFSIFGSRDVTVTGGDGPHIAIRGVAIFGSVDVKPPKPS